MASELHLDTLGAAFAPQSLPDLPRARDAAPPALAPPTTTPIRDTFEPAAEPPRSWLGRFASGFGAEVEETGRGAYRALLDPLPALGGAWASIRRGATDLWNDPRGTVGGAMQGVVDFTRQAGPEEWGGAAAGLAMGAAGGGAAGLAARRVARAAGVAGRATGYEVGGVRAASAAELERGLEAAGYRRVLGGEVQRVYERDGRFVKLANTGSPEARARNPAWAAQRDLEATQGVTERLALMDRLRGQFGDLIPEARRIGPTAYVQDAARGVDIRDLPADVRGVAQRNATELLRDARARNPGTVFDPNVYNFRFDPTGRVTSWFDPD
jgi:hypothetical protein